MMEMLEHFASISLGLIAIVVAFWQLKLQREEIKRSGKVTALSHMASTLKDKIDYYEKIIEARKAKQGNWKGHADKVNQEFRPLLEKLNNDIIELSNDYDLSLSASDIKALVTQSREND